MNLHELFRNRRKCEPSFRPVTLDELHRTEARIEALLLALLLELKKNHKAVDFDFAVGLPVNKTKETHMPLALTITNEQQIKVTLNPVTATGKPAKLDGAPVWSVINGNSTVTPADDGLSATLVSADDPGDTQYSVKADADLGSGVVEVADVITLTVEGALAASLGLVAGTPEAKP